MISRTLIAGGALILAVNAIALGGVAYNRSGEPESAVHMSERELRLPYGRLNSTENSGVTLNLAWRVFTGNDARENYYGPGYYGGAADWLDKAKLETLGFDVAQEHLRSGRNSKQPRMKDVLLVLELDGPAYRQTLERVRQKAEDEEKLKADNPGNKEFERRAKQARENALREEKENSRLFAIDAGLDARALRAQYPDKAKFLIVGAQVRPQVQTRDRQERLVGNISAINISQINVPLEFQDALKTSGQPNRKASFEATVAYGKRLEPWLVTLTASKPGP